MQKILINYFLVFLLFVASSSNAQTLKRTVLYTLSQNEVFNNGFYYSFLDNKRNENNLWNTDFFVEPDDTNYNFAAIIVPMGSGGDRLTLIFNNIHFQICRPQKESDFCEYLPFIDIKKRNGLAFKYKDSVDVYLNIYNELFGPYDDANLFIINGEIAFSYKLFDKWYERVKGEVIGPFTESAPHAKTNNEENQKKNILIKDSIFFIESKFEYLEGEGVIFSTNNKHQLIYNKELIPFSEPDDNYAYDTFKFNYVVVDGKKYGKAVPINAKWYEERKSFIWNVIEEKELVVYELTFEN